MAEIKERPILFQGEMVRAILEGRKTQTRRIMKPQPVLEQIRHGIWPGGNFWNWKDCTWLDGGIGFPESGIADYAPYKPGMRLWVRETWQHSGDPRPVTEKSTIFYRADYHDDPHGPDGEKSSEGKYRNWRPSIHMPRIASRILLEVADVRVERLQDISEEDAIAEGVTAYPPFSIKPYTRSYRDLWERINGPGSWDANPWVWAISFRVLEVRHG